MERCSLMPRPVGAVHQQNVQPAVAVVIEKGATRPQGFGQVLRAESPAVVAEVDARRAGNIVQTKARSPPSSPSGQRDAAPAMKFAPPHAMLTRPLRIA